MSQDKGGRPTDYDPKFSDVAAQMCARGSTIAELAEKFGVARSTVYLWMATHQEFSDAISAAREVADKRVEFSLYERAVGYTYDAVKILQNAGVPLVVPYREHVPPDVGAQKHWLSNRQPEKWRELSKHEVTGKDGGPIETKDVSDIEAAQRVAYMLGQAIARQRAKADATSTEA